MPKTTCSVEGCDRAKKARGWCHTHYMRWYERGQIPDSPIREWGRDRVCQVDGCDRRHSYNGYCQAHSRRVETVGDPGDADIKPASVGDDADYYLVHNRLKRYRGKASGYSCVQCGDQAKHWAYDHADENEKIDEAVGIAYSLDQDHYQPMCVSCHTRFDRAHKHGTPVEVLSFTAN